MSTYEINDTECVGETEKAIKVVSPELDEPTWIPKSQIHDDSEVYEDGTEGILVVKEWFAKQRGWW